MSWRRVTIVSACLLAAAAAAMGGWSLFLRPIRVEVVTVERDVPVQVFGLGTVEARTVSKVGFKVAGILSELLADHGDRVAKGAVLARLDTREQAARLSRAKASVDQAEATLGRAAASVGKAEATYANAKSINDRRQALVQSSNVSVEAAETAKANLDIARAELSLARSDVEVARAAAKDARAQVQLESVTLDLHTLVAPFDALVVTRLRENGTVLSAGEPVFTLVDPQTVWVLAYIDESKAGPIEVGQPAEIVLRSLPARRFQGNVARIQIESDRVNEERRIEVAFKDIPQDFHLGEQAEVYITFAALPQALLIPEAAIEEFKGSRGIVWTVVDGRLSQREVPLGHRMLDGRIEIAGTIPDGVRVLARLPGGLRVGRNVTIIGSSDR